MTRRRTRPKAQNSSVQFIQIMGLALVLVIILLFRDQIGAGAGQFLGSFESEDVVLPNETTSKPADSTE